MLAILPITFLNRLNLIANAYNMINVTVIIFIPALFMYFVALNNARKLYMTYLFTDDPK